MLDLETCRELRSGKRYQTKAGRTRSENGSIEENRISMSSENVVEEVLEIETLTHKVLNEQIKVFIAP